MLIYNLKYAVETTMAQSAKLCQKTLKETGCDLAQCQQQCFQELNGRGQCLISRDQTTYACICVYKC